MTLGEPLQGLTRIIGRYRGTRPGPLVICVGGMHGNEPAGVVACRRVLAALEGRRPAFRGEWLALAGNIPALYRQRRFVDEDLNRIWLADRIRKRAAGFLRNSVEAREQDELLSEIEAALARGGAGTYFVDLHTTSAMGSSFCVFADTLRNRRLARNLPGPLVLGLEEHLEGTLLNYVNDLGHVAVGFEAGQHASPESVDRHELAIWKTLSFAGCLSPRQVAMYTGSPASFQPGPRVVEIRYRHGVEPDDGFVMEPGFRNLQPVESGRLMARDRSGPIRARSVGRVLMPLYQSQGSDGFFIVGDVSPIWLGISTLVRRLRLGLLAAYLPGVRPHPSIADALLVEWPLSGRIVTNLFHILGYRRRTGDGNTVVVQWRREAPRR